VIQTGKEDALDLIELGPTAWGGIKDYFPRILSLVNWSDVYNHAESFVSAVPGA